MADNTTLNAGSGGDQIRTIDHSGVKTPATKLCVGGAAGESLVGNAGIGVPVEGIADEDGAASTAKPVLIGGRYDATARTLDDADLGALATDIAGRLLVMNSAIQGPGLPVIDSYTHKVVDVAADSTDANIVSTPGANKQIWVYSMMLQLSTADGTLTIQDSDNNAVGGVFTATQDGWAFSKDAPGNFAMPLLKVPTDKGLEFDTVGTAVDGWITYAIVSV